MNNNEENIKKKGNGRELFYIVITVAIFIVMAVGATFAFFTATTSSGDSDVGTRSTTLSLEYISYGTAWSRSDLLPAPRIDTEYSVEFQDDTTLGNNTLLGNTLPETKGKMDNENNTLCKDDVGNSLCSIYEFQVRNPAASDQAVNINLITESNGFINLKAMIYEVSVVNATNYNNTASSDTAGNNGYGDPIFKASEDDETAGAIQVKNGYNENVYNETPIYVNRTGVTKTLLQYEQSPEDEVTNLAPSINRPVSTSYEGEITLANNVTIPGGNTTKSFIVVLYILNLNEDQTEDDANKTFSGKITVTNGTGTGGVSGEIGLASGQQLQGDVSQEPAPEPGGP